MIYGWIAAIVVLTIVEVLTVNLTTIWFVGGGIAALVTALFTDNFVIQFGVFVIVGVTLLLTTKPLVAKWMQRRDVPTNADRVINMRGVVTEEINIAVTGEVKVDGKRWTAFAKKRIEEGKVVRVLAIEGVKLEVEEIKEIEEMEE